MTDDAVNCIREKNIYMYSILSNVFVCENIFWIMQHYWVYVSVCAEHKMQFLICYWLVVYHWLMAVCNYIRCTKNVLWKSMHLYVAFIFLHDFIAFSSQIPEKFITLLLSVHTILWSHIIVIIGIMSIDRWTI